MVKYKTVMKRGVITQQLFLSSCLLDMGREYKLIHREFSKKNWIINIKTQQLPSLQNATKKPISLDGTMLLFMQIDNLSVRVWFGVDKNLAFDVLHETSFEDRFIHGIFRSERMVVLIHACASY